ncbi:hypothetical protein PFISCL1PPCAC_22145, partial [Pristionchus fissidentatus]
FYDLPVMSSFTSAASLRRNCLILSSDKQNIVSAHGPFLDSHNLAKWERKKSKPTEPPVRVKVFENMCVDTVLPLGTSGHAVAVSKFVHDVASKQYKVYATLVHSADLAGGGYVNPKIRFVINSQPLTETPCQPSVNIVPESSKLLVLTGDSLKVFEVVTDSEGNCTGWSEVESIDVRSDLKRFYQPSGAILPLFLCPLHPFEFALSYDSKVALATYKYDKKAKK